MIFYHFFVQCFIIHDRPQCVILLLHKENRWSIRQGTKFYPLFFQVSCTYFFAFSSSFAFNLYIGLRGGLLPSSKGIIWTIFLSRGSSLGKNSKTSLNSSNNGIKQHPLVDKGTLSCSTFVNYKRIGATTFFFIVFFNCITKQFFKLRI